MEQPSAEKTATEVVAETRPINSLGADQCRVMVNDVKTLASWIMEHTATVPISHHNLGFEVGAALLHVDACRILGMPKMAYKVGGGLGYDTEQLHYVETAVVKAAALIAASHKIVLDIEVQSD